MEPGKNVKHSQHIIKALLILRVSICIAIPAYFYYEIGSILFSISILIILIWHRGFTYKIEVVEKDVYIYRLYFQKIIIPISSIQNYYIGTDSDFIESTVGKFKTIPQKEKDEQFQSLIFDINSEIHKEEITEGIFFFERLLGRLDLENHPLRVIPVVFATIIFAIVIPTAIFCHELLVEIAVEYGGDMLKFLETDLKHLIFGQGEKIGFD